MNSTLLWLVDISTDFMREDGKLPVPEAPKIIPNLVKLIEAQRKANGKIVWTADEHLKDDPEFKLFGEHCVRGTDGQKIIEEAAPGENHVSFRRDNFDPDIPDIASFILLDMAKEILLHKNTTNVFDSVVGIDKVLKTLNPASIVVAGVATDVCVDQAVLGLVDRGYTVVVVTDAISSLGITSDTEIMDYWYDKDVLFITTEDFVIGSEGRNTDDIR